MQHLGPIDHLETYLEAVYFDLPVASLARVGRFPYNFDLAVLAEHCTVGVRWRAQLGLAGHLDCSADNCPLPDLDLLTMSFAESPRLSVWLEGLAVLMAVPLSPAYTSREKPGSALVCFDDNPRLADSGQPEEARVIAQMMVC